MTSEFLRKRKKKEGTSYRNKERKRKREREGEKEKERKRESMGSLQISPIETAGGVVKIHLRKYWNNSYTLSVDILPLLLSLSLVIKLSYLALKHYSN